MNTITEIDYKNTVCPICQTKGKYQKHYEDLECSVCGAIIETPYPYVAGRKFMFMDFKTKTVKRKNKK